MTSERQKDFDVLVIGGGIVGASAARDIAGRGLSVMLCERDDLASSASSATTKLALGALCYPGHAGQRLAPAALKEKNILCRAAPHIVRPVTLVLPHDAALGPRALVRANLFFRDILAGWKTLPRSRALSMPGTVAAQPLKPLFRYGFSTADCWVEDTRLAVINALDAKERGADIITRAACVALDAQPDGSGWVATLKDMIGETHTTIRARIVVNAAGAWGEEVRRMAGVDDPSVRARPVRYSHIIVPRLYRGAHAYALRNADGRMIYVLPYEEKYSLIGAADADETGDPDEARIGLEEVEYLCATVSRVFRAELTPADVQWTYSGVHPTVADEKGLTSRDGALDVRDASGAPMISLYGGGIASVRPLAECAGDRIAGLLGRGGGAWTRNAVLPGGEGIAVFETFYKTFRREYGWVPEETAARLARTYGARTRDMLRGFKRVSDMGEHFGNGVYEAEIRYLVNVEWAMSADDILWRRSKLGLHVEEETEQKIRAFLADTMTA